MSAFTHRKEWNYSPATCWAIGFWDREWWRNREGGVHVRRNSPIAYAWQISQRCLKTWRATGEGVSELPTESKMLESTRALINLQDEYRARAAHNIAHAQERQKQQYDRKHNTNTTLKIGDKVLQENSKNKHWMGGKLGIRWTGPFIRKENVSAENTCRKDPETDPETDCPHIWTRNVTV